MILDAMGRLEPVHFISGVFKLLLVSSAAKSNCSQRCAASITRSKIVKPRLLVKYDTMWARAYSMECLRGLQVFRRCWPQGAY